MRVIKLPTAKGDVNVTDLGTIEPGVGICSERTDEPALTNGLRFARFEWDGNHVDKNVSGSFFEVPIPDWFPEELR